MRIVNEKLLDVYRTAGRCEWCNQRRPTEPHHASAKGMGSGKRLDIHCNLLAVGRSVPHPFCPCHTLIHNGGKVRAKMALEIIAEREATTPEAIIEVRDLFRRLPKTISEKRKYAEYSQLDFVPGALFLREINIALEMGALTLE